MRKIRTDCLFVLLAAGAVGFSPAPAQESASYRLTEHALNAGGVPSQGQVHTSAGFRLTLESIAGPVGHLASRSKAYGAWGGLVPGLVPASEVTGLRFADGDTLTWDGHVSAGTFRVYREGLDAVGPVLGSCLAGGVAAPTSDDASVPPPGTGYAYLVTVANTLGEEGTPGSASSGIPRTLGSACP